MATTWLFFVVMISKNIITHLLHSPLDLTAEFLLGAQQAYVRQKLRRYHIMSLEYQVMSSRCQVMSLRYQVMSLMHQVMSLSNLRHIHHWLTDLTRQL